jgi:hypothetical protein
MRCFHGNSAIKYVAAAAAAAAAGGFSTLPLSVSVNINVFCQMTSIQILVAAVVEQLISVAARRLIPLLTGIAGLNYRIFRPCFCVLPDGLMPCYGPGA